MTGKEAKEIRYKLGLSQTEFWTKLGVTQSGSSRYEKGRGMPKPTQLLFKIAYGTKREAAAIYKALRGS